MALKNIGTCIVDMEIICDKRNCTGCGLCVSNCPKHCISMEIGELRHLYPHINQDKCIDCGLCKKSCPSLHDIRCSYPAAAYAAWSKDENDYESSTSGGMASVLTNYVLSNGGVVYGCTVLPSIKIRHVRIDNIDEAYRLKGSKYVQSSIVDALRQIRKDIKDGRHVLFIGTPCQVAAVKQMYKEQPENLYLVDIICHGVPSNEWLKEYITKDLKIDKTKVSSVSFRQKNANRLCIFKDEDLIYQSKKLWTHHGDDLYLASFMDAFTSRESCYNCHYAKPERISDITIGDFWGLGKEKDDADIPAHPYGISCALPITEKGKDLILAVNDNLNIYERPVTEAINGNDQLKAPKKENLRIKIFRKIYGKIGIEAAYKLCNLDKIFKHSIKNMIIKK